MSAKIIKLGADPAQWEVAVDLDIPAHKANDPAVQSLLQTIAHRVERAVVGDQALMSEMKRLGVNFVGVRVEDA